MTATKQIDQSKGIRHALSWATATLGLLLVSATAMAANVLQDVRYAAAPGGKVDITLQFAGPVGEVQAFTTDSPPRIAIDLPNTSNGLSARRVAIGSGATSAVSAAEAGGRTRVVVDLFRPAGYTTRSSGNLLVVTVDAGSVPASANNAMVSRADPSKHVASNLQVAKIDFRRGDNGAGRIILRFSGDGAAADMHSEGSQVVVDVNNAQIPENLRRHLDVTDFATPVASLDPSSNGGSTRLVINTNGDYDSMAYQTGDEYVVEIAPKRGQVIAASGQHMQAAGAVDSSGASTERYSGKPVTFNFQDVPVRTVLQLIAEESNLNIVASDTVGGNLTLRLINVPWDQALQIVLRAKGLDMRRDGNVVWVAPQAELAAYEQALNNARIALENSSELVSEYIPINFGSAVDIAALIQNPGSSSAGGGGASTAGGRGFLSPRGSVTADARTNTLLVVDTAEKVAEIKKLLLTIDRAVDQVLIEARIVVANETFAHDLGVKFGVGNVNNPSNSSSTTTTDGFNISLPVAGAAGTFNLSILRASSNLDLELSALESEGRGEVISNPRVITSNQREAVITQGDEIGYFTSNAASASGGNTSTGVPVSTVAFKDVLLELKVTPTITQDGRVYLNLSVKKDDVKSFLTTSSGSVPSLTKRAVSTAVLVDNGQTVVIGGVYEYKNRQDITKVPFFGDIPFLGNLFKKNEKSTDKAELLIFVTPRVLQVAHHGVEVAPVPMHENPQLPAFRN
jgi:type IV pilus assembly protein PilQ